MMRATPLFGQGLDRFLVQAVALTQAAGDIGDNVSPPGGEELGEQAGGGDAVHIVVAVDSDQLSQLQGQLYPADCPVHVFQKHGVRDGLRIRVEQPPGVLRADYPPGGQQPGQQRGKPGMFQGQLSIRTGRSHLPLFVFHRESPLICERSAGRITSY